MSNILVEGGGSQPRLARTTDQGSTLRPGKRQSAAPTFSGPTIPASVYAALPDELRNACLLLREGHERDVFLTGLLPCLSAALPNVLTRYSRRRKALSLMAAVVAPAGSGKGTLQLAAETINSVDERLRTASKDEVSAWQEQDPKERTGEEPPPYLSLRLAADSSLRAITDALIAGGGRGLIFETEIRVMASSLKQDWGDFKGLLLKAAEQEAYERSRKGEPPAYIRRPELAAALSGTPRSFTDWMQDTEDGLFSRFLFYSFTAPPTWQNQFEDETDAALDAAIARISERIDTMHHSLSGRPMDEHGQPTPLYLNLGSAEQRIINTAFAALHEHLHAWQRPELLASVKRGAFQAVRIAGVLAAYRLAASGTDLSHVKSYTPTLKEVAAAVELVRCYLQHAAALAVSFANDPAARLDSEERRRFFEHLPKTFTTAAAHGIGEALGMNSRKVERALMAMMEQYDLLERERHGHYRKLLPTPSALLSEVSETLEPSETNSERSPLPTPPPLPTVPTSPTYPIPRHPLNTDVTTDYDPALDAFL